MKGVLLKDGREPEESRHGWQFICVFNSQLYVVGPQYSDSSDVRHPSHSHRLFQYWLRLLKLVVQCVYIAHAAAPAPNGRAADSTERRRSLRRRNLPKIHRHRLASQYSLFRFRRRDAVTASGRQRITLVRHIGLVLLFLFGHSYSNARRLQSSKRTRDNTRVPFQ